MGEVEFRELRYFLTIAQEGSISSAAKALHMTQPSLSRQMRKLEENFGKTLFIRGNRSNRLIRLTEEGQKLKRRASEIIQLMEKTKYEISNGSDDMSGDIYIGAVETKAVRYLARTAAALMASYPNVHFHITSGDTRDNMYRLEQGLIDFALLFDPPDLEKYDCIRLPVSDSMAALMRKDHPLSERKSVSLRYDLAAEPLIISSLARDIADCEIKLASLNIVGTYDLACNALIMAEYGLGIALCFDGTLNVSGWSDLRLVPITDMDAVTGPVVVWKKHQTMTHVAKAYIEKLVTVKSSNFREG